MSKNKEMREGQMVFGGMLAIFVAWMIQPIAATIAGIKTGTGQWGYALTQPNLIWGVNSHVERFWVADVATWAALISGVAAAYLLVRNSPRSDSDPFLVARRSEGGWRSASALTLGAILVVAGVSVVGCALLVSPLAGVVLGIPLAAGPVLGILAASRRKGGRETIPGDRIILGSPKGDRRHWVAVKPDMSVFMLGSPSSGKTGGIIIPNLLTWDGAAVSTSTKFDVVSETIRRRSELGQVWVWAPLDDVESIPTGAHRLSYSPISGSTDWRVASRHADALVHTNSNPENEVWVASAGQLLACGFHACAISGEGMTKCLEVLKQAGWRWIERTLEQPNADPAALASLASLKGGANPRFIADMQRNIDQAFSLVRGGHIVDDAGGEELDWVKFLNGRDTLYIILPTELPHVDPAPYVNVLLADLVYAVRRVSAAHGHRLPYRLLMLLDELGALCSIDNLDNLIATQRAAGMSFLLAAQSLAQIDRRYGQGGTRTIRDAVGAIVLGMGVSDDEALRDMETLVGGAVSLQQQMGSGRKQDAPDVIEDQADRWARHQIAALAQYHFYVHLKGASKPQHVKAPFFMDQPFRALWEGTAGGPEAPKVEVLDGDEAIAEDEDEDEGQVVTMMPALNALANHWVEVVEDVWTRLTAPGLQLQIAGFAAEQQAALKGLDLGHDVRGANVTGLNNVKPLRPGEKLAERPIMVLGQGSEKTVPEAADKEQEGEAGEDSGSGGAVTTVEEEPVEGASAGLEEEEEPTSELPTEPSSERAGGIVMDDFPSLTAEPTADRDRLFLADEEDFPPLENQASSTPATPLVAAAPEPETVTLDPSEERPNRYRGDCIVCGKRVEEKAGLTFKKVDRWLVRHPDCQIRN